MNKTPLASLLTVSSLALTLLSMPAFAENYYRHPGLQQSDLIYTAEGDLWLKNLANNSSPIRLTTSDAEETEGQVSPDGTMVAFVANYEGVSEVYVMPKSGGTPKRVSYEQGRIRLQGWTPSGKVLLSTDSVIGPSNQWVLKSVDPETLVTHTYPVVDAIQGTLNQREDTLYFVRFGLQATGDNARVYRGGAMGELWSFKTGQEEEAVQLIPDHEGSIEDPMFANGRVYFTSDASGTRNLWSVNPQGEDIRQHTEYDDWQIWDVSTSGQYAVMQQGADLVRLNLRNNTREVLALETTSDYRQRQERWLENPMDYAQHASFTGHEDTNKERVVITARSQIALASSNGQRLIHINTPEGSRSREAILSPDGQWVYAINDASGENEIWRFAADGTERREQLTTNGDTFRWGLFISPDGRYLAHDDKHGNLYVLDIEEGESQIIDEGLAGHWNVASVSWSTGSNLVAFARNHQESERTQIVLYSFDDERSEVLTSDRYESYSPTFSSDGNWLYFLSDRHFNATPGSPWGDRNMGPVFDQRTQIYGLALKRQACFPFAEPTEVTLCNDEEANDEKERMFNAKTVDWEGLTERLWHVPVEPDNYFDLSASDSRLYVMASPIGTRQSSLYQIPFSNTDIKRETFASGVNMYELSLNRERLFYSQPGDHNNFVVAAGASAPGDTSSARLNTAQWQFAFSPREEWRQMFHDAWIMHRDFLFDANMRGVDWDAMYDKYRPMVERITDRHELDDVFAQLLSELSVLHSQVRGGDYASRDNVPSAASLGAAITTRENGVFIEHIYRTDPELPETASPLATPGVRAATGNQIVRVNGTEVSTVADVTRALRGQTGRQVRLDLAQGRESWATVVTPTSLWQDHRLRYQDWVLRNRERVDKASDNEFGYIHLYSMTSSDIESFARDFYTNIDKKGLIIDVRRNRGGNIDSWIIEKLMRRVWMFWRAASGSPFVNMQQTFRGQLVVLTDQLTYSDGETFSAGIKTLGLGPLIGERTTGAGVWLTGRNSLADRGMARVAESAQFAMDGTWVVEGYGVEPDIEIDNLPHATFNGEDAQLQRAIEELETRLEAMPYPELNPGDFSAPYGADPVNRP
ncbi:MULTISPECIES: S41 family peptidase [Gammaproteobacteria]|uniref:S41 family peptidase n=1 Tax=Gammaproteobacteria TaxID=1236 RepID=UPI000DCFAE30|nr:MULTISPECIES: S41 family peptidase [Gammaproteobacteria]RTE85951.1 peptidase S41 [Aliidiomarina sp. B3213]TCZ90050.1 peptidase S41 [Lysobacter sp. N42]